MASFFARPESPPPRIPSPPPSFFTPLASPASRSHRKPSTSSCSSCAPSLPPGLQREKTLLTVRSYEHIRKHEFALHRQPKRIRSSLGHSAYSSSRTNSLPEPLAHPIIPPSHNRTLSLATQSSPCPSPQSQMDLHPPPVPPIPSFVLTPADKKPTQQSDSPSVTPIYLPGFGSDAHLPDLSASVTKTKKPGLGKAGMTCLRFLSLRNSLKSDRL